MLADSVQGDDENRGLSIGKREAPDYPACGRPTASKSFQRRKIEEAKQKA